VFRLHDHWDSHQPDGIIGGMAISLGWMKYQNPDKALLFVLPETTLNALAIQSRDQLKIRAIRVVGDPQMIVSRAAFTCARKCAAVQPGTAAPFSTELFSWAI
jgi:hypothetical protein